MSYLRYASNEQDKTSFTRLEKIGKRRLKKFIEFLELQKKDDKLSLIEEAAPTRSVAFKSSAV